MKANVTRRTISHNKRIAKNTIFLYLRMLLSLIVSLYTSRVILQVLGVSDYGIYTVVGGIVVMFSFLNSSMSGATSRFLTYEIGRNNIKTLKETFSSAMEVHLAIALIIFVVAETLGLWLLVTKLNIPSDRMVAVHFVYQTSVVSMVVGVLQVPYNASIIAHEKMDIYAYIEMLNIFLRLIIVYILLVVKFDKLIFYSFLILGISILIAILYRVYCIHKFNECRFYKIWKPEIIKPILYFSGWDLYGNMSVTVQQQGLNIIVNHFLGVVINASCGIAATVNSGVSGFARNIIMAFRPQIIQSYAQGNIQEMSNLMTNASKYCLLLFLAISLPLIAEMPYVLQLWLVKVPQKAIEICRIVLLANIPGLLNSVVIIGIHATGKIKTLSFFSGTLFLITLLPIYIILYCGGSIENIYWSVFIAMVVIFISDCIIIRQHIPEFPLLTFLSEIFSKTLLVSLIVSLLLYCLTKYLSIGLLQLVLSIGLSFIIFGSYTYWFGINNDIRDNIREKVSILLKVSRLS